MFHICQIHMVSMNSELTVSNDLVVERRRSNPHGRFERSPVRFPWWLAFPLVLVVDSGILDGGYKQG